MRALLSIVLVSCSSSTPVGGKTCDPSEPSAPGPTATSASAPSVSSEPTPSVPTDPTGTATSTGSTPQDSGTAPPVDGDGDGVASDVDCDDDDAAAHPGATEICDGIDDDCDPGTVEDGLVTVGVTNYPSIGEAAYFAPPDATISVCPGTWPEAVVLDRPAHLIGVGGADATVIDATGLGVRALSVVGAGAYEVEGLTITGGNGGIEVGQDVELTVRDAVITGNHAISDEGGGIVDASYYWSPASLWLEDVEISDNVADWEGGGVFLGSGPHTLVRVQLLDNLGASGGGGIYVSDNTTLTTVTDCTFWGNSATLDGGGAILLGWDAGEVVVTNSDFGVGTTENLPNDVQIYDFDGSATYPWFQAGESFTCSTVTDTCL